MTISYHTLGQCYIGAAADRVDTEIESDETNNALASTPIDVP